jgi:uncharacterized protein YndB with AHSA1/START domain
MLPRILLFVVVAIAAILVYAALKPDAFQVRRSITIQAPPEKVFALINDLHNWKSWAPQDKEDPTMSRTFSGAASGVGAVSQWHGTGSTGKGTMTITASVPPQMVTVAVDWEKPFAARNINAFSLEDSAGSTKVTWAMHGPNLYIMKLMSVFVNMDGMMGKHFEAGLNNLKQTAEQ